MDDTQPPLPAATPSVLDPISRAFDWMVQVLFRPFDIGKWFVLGFCAWLAFIGEGGGPSSTSQWVQDDSRRHQVDRAGDWIAANVALVVTLAIFFVFFIVALIVVLTWLSSRGKFLFLDGVVHNRGAVVEPWGRFRQLANSLFGFRLILGLAGLLVIGTTVGLMLLTLLATGMRRGDLSPAGVVLLVLWLLFIVGIGLCLALVGMAANDFVVPIMWLRKVRVMEAWSEFLSLLSSRIGLFALYVLFKVLIFASIVGLACLITCVTCCLAALPYIGTVILLPLFVFRRGYSMYFLSQFSPDYAPLAPVVAAAESPPPSDPPPPGRSPSPEESPPPVR